MISSSNDSWIAVNHVLQRLHSQRATCKIWGVVLASVALLYASGRPGGTPLLWLAAPVILLALADASYASQASRIATFAAKYGANDDTLVKDLVQFQAASGGMHSMKTFSLALAVSSGPFYLALTALTAGLGTTVLKSDAMPMPTIRNYSQPISVTPSALLPSGALPNGTPTATTLASPVTGGNAKVPRFNYSIRPHDSSPPARTITAPKPQPFVSAQGAMPPKPPPASAPPRSSAGLTSPTLTPSPAPAANGNSGN